MLTLGSAGCAARRGRPHKGAPPPAYVTGGKPSKPVALPPTKEVDSVAASALREKALEVIESCAGDPNPFVRGNAMEAAALAPARTSAIVKRGLVDESPVVRSIAAMSVGRSHLSELVPEVRVLLDDQSERAEYVKSAAMYALFRSGEYVDLSPMADWLLHGAQVSLRSHVAFLLGELADSSAVPLLQQAARMSVAGATPSELKLMQLQIAEALIKLGQQDQLPVVRAALYPSRAEDLESTALAVQILGQVRDRAAEDELIFLAERRDRQGREMPAEVRLAAASTLARLGRPRGDFIADEYVQNSSPAIRAQAAQVYGDTGKNTNLSRLADLMKDPDGGVRVAAAAAILKIEGSGAGIASQR